MHNLDINEIRDPHIITYGLTRANERYTFYYDETNNIRKLYIGAKGLNINDLKVFVLGGIVHKNGKHPLDMESLRKEINVQSSATEIKLKHIANGNFIEILTSTKLTSFLKWLIRNDLMIHCHALDPFYWSITDIIDSIIIERIELIQIRINLITDLHEILRVNFQNTIEIFKHYNYPDLSPKDRKPFLDDIIKILNIPNNTMNTFRIKMLIDVLKIGKTQDTLDFIEGNKAGELIDNFSIFYLTRIALFKYAEHILDNEPYIQDYFSRFSITDRGKIVNHYRFANSKSEIGIQVSDIIVGLFGKLYTFFTEKSLNDVIRIRSELYGTSIENIKLISNLIDSADRENKAFLHHVSSINDLEK